MAIPAIAPVVSPPSLSPSPETCDQKHRLTVVQKKILTMHMGMEHVGAKREYAASCHSMDFINDVTITSSCSGRRKVTCCTLRHCILERIMISYIAT